MQVELPNFSRLGVHQQAVAAHRSNGEGRSISRRSPGRSRAGRSLIAPQRGQDVFVQFEAVAVGQHPLRGGDGAPHDELGDAAEGRNSDSVNKITLIRRSPKLKPAAATPDLCTRHDSSILYVH
jgi:hypothetical protein